MSCATRHSVTSKWYPLSRAASSMHTADPEDRDAPAAPAVSTPKPSLLARKGRTLITENALGLVQARRRVERLTVRLG